MKGPGANKPTKYKKTQIKQKTNIPQCGVITTFLEFRENTMYFE